MKTIGIKFPFEESELGHFFGLSKTTNEKILSNFKFIITVDKNERLYHPNFSFNLKDYLFEPMDRTTVDNLLSELKEITKRYFPNIKLSSIEPTLNEQNRMLSITINGLVNGSSFSEEINF